MRILTFWLSSLLHSVAWSIKEFWVPDGFCIEGSLSCREHSLADGTKISRVALLMDAREFSLYSVALRESRILSPSRGLCTEEMTAESLLQRTVQVNRVALPFIWWRELLLVILSLPVDYRYSTAKTKNLCPEGFASHRFLTPALRDHSPPIQAPLWVKKEVKDPLP